MGKTKGQEIQKINKTIKKKTVRKKKVLNVNLEQNIPQKSNDSQSSKQHDPYAQIERPAPPSLDPLKDSLIFQQLDIDNYIATPINEMFKWNEPELRIVPVMRMFGLTMDGNSVCCHIHGFSPYFYVSVPKNFDEKNCDYLKNSLNNAILNHLISNRNEANKAVLNVSLVRAQSLMYYNNDVKDYAKITITLQSYMAVTKRLIEKNATEYNLINPLFFESNIDFGIRFMIDTKVVGCSWIELPAGKWKIRDNNSTNMRPMSSCQIEADIAWHDFIAYEPEGEWAKVAPCRILSFDIECANRRGIFPTPDLDPVIQIANVVVNQGGTEPFIKNVFTLNTCAPIAGIQLYCFRTEQEMLLEWSKFIRLLDPDFITGYNINNFDFLYLLKRAQHLKVIDFDLLGRIRNERSSIKRSFAKSKQLGNRESYDFNMIGRILFDVLNVILRDHKLRSYNLNAVSYHFLNERKDSIHHSIISELQNNDNQTRRRLAIYCLKDAELPLRLLQKLMCIINYMEMARVTGVPLSFLLTRGQQIKVVSQLLRKAKAAGFIMPTYQVLNGNQQYEGGAVIEPLKGYYESPITTLDFASLYPSIMMAHNLCYTTLLPKNINEDLRSTLPDDEITHTPNDNMFVKASVRKGLLPEILESLLSARKKAKTELKNEKDPFKRSVLDGRQLALKISANSVYGFTGAQFGKLPCLEISGSVTAYGRSMIMQTKQEVEKIYNKANGYEEDALVIYGDTDSVMIKFGTDLKRSMELGSNAAKLISEKFIAPIKLDFEKVYYPYLLINKKRYAGLIYTRPDKADKIDHKGIETVRRDNCLLVSNVMKKCIDKIFYERDTKGAIGYVRQKISDLLCNKIDISQLVITKELGKATYKKKLPHVELAKKMEERNPGNGPKLGDRIQYVMCMQHDKAKNYEKAEDPMYVLENNLPLDIKYYLEKQLINPLLRLFDPIYPNKAKEKLLEGYSHQLKTLVAPRINPLAKFLIKVETCLNCKAKLQMNHKNPLCDQCVKNVPHIFCNEIQKLKTLEENFSKAWTQCQRCQGSLHQEILCTSTDCPIFYKRKKIGMELSSQEKRIKTFEDIEW